MQFEDLVVGDVDTVVREDGSEPGDYPALPVDQGTVAVEADDLVSSGVDQSFPSESAGYPLPLGHLLGRFFRGSELAAEQVSPEDHGEGDHARYQQGALLGDHSHRDEHRTHGGYREVRQPRVEPHP